MFLSRFWKWCGAHASPVATIAAIVGIAGVIVAGIFFLGELSARTEHEESRGDSAKDPSKSAALASAHPPRVELVLLCPNKVQSHESYVHGRAPPGSRIFVYVCTPEVGPVCWPPVDVSPDESGEWESLVRFGNPFGLGHDDPLPTKYKVIAALASDTRSAPKPSELAQRKADIAFFEDQGMIARACFVTREIEQAVTCGKEGLKIESPAAATCPFAAGILAEPDCDPTKVANIASPVTFRWSSEEPLYAELYPQHDVRLHLSRELEPKFSAQEKLANNASVDLQPGLYEFKIARTKTSLCKASVWFRVEK